jgi:hypothetical protein
MDKNRTDKDQNFYFRKKKPFFRNKFKDKTSEVSHLQPLEKCSNTLLNKLKILKDQHILQYSLLLHNSTFEILEFYGDSVLYERISFFMMQTRRFMSPHLLTQLRCSVIQNINLARTFETLNLNELLATNCTRTLEFKEKADVVEAIIGELNECCLRGNLLSDCRFIKGVLDEFLAYICYMGEQNYFIGQNSNSEADSRSVRQQSFERNSNNEGESSNSSINTTTLPNFYFSENRDEVGDRNVTEYSSVYFN